jgi:hypothetical protein
MQECSAAAVETNDEKRRLFKMKISDPSSPDQFLKKVKKSKDHSYNEGKSGFEIIPGINLVYLKQFNNNSRGTAGK